MKYAILSLVLLTPMYAVCAESRKVDELTPLMLAAKRGELAQVKSLLSDGADSTATYKGETALAIARKNKKENKRGFWSLRHMKNNNRREVAERYYRQQKDYECIIGTLEEKKPGCFSWLFNRV